jgi:low temperature requirement protein LtrA
MAADLAGTCTWTAATTLWWLYFDQSAEAAAERITRSDDPGRLGRSAYPSSIR